MSDLNVGVTEEELKFRTQHFHDLRELKQRGLSCASCGNALGDNSTEIFAHSILSILQCRKCNDQLKYTLDVGDSSISCHLCAAPRKNTHACSRKNCSYKFCQACIKRNAPKSLVEVESKKWKCFACNSKPLWKLRGVCAAVMSTVSKRTKRQKVSRNRSHDSEDEKLALKDISYVRRRELSKSKELRKRLDAVCDDDSPVPDSLPLRFNVGRNNGDSKKNQSKRSTKLEEYYGRETTSLSVTASSEDSDTERTNVSRSESKSTKSPEMRREKRALGSRRDSRNDNGKVRKNSKNTMESDSTVSRNSRALSSTNSESSSDGSDVEFVKRTSSSKSGKQKTKIKDKACEKRRQNVVLDISDEGEKPSRKKRRTSITSDSKSNRGRTARRKIGEIVDLSKDEDSPIETRNSSESIAKTLSQNGATKRSVRDVARARKPVRDKSSSEKNEDSEESTKKNRQSRNDDDALSGGNEKVKRKSKKTVHHRSMLNNKSVSDSSSGKEFTQTKLCRTSYIPLKRIAELDEDYTKTPDQSPDKPVDLLTNDQTFELKNKVTNYFSELKKAATKLICDIENAQTTLRKKRSLRTSDVDLLMLETENVVTDLKQRIDSGENKVVEYYDEWCKKTRVKNVLRPKRRNNEDEPSSFRSKKISPTTLHNNPDSENEPVSPRRLESPPRRENTPINTVGSPSANRTEKVAVVSSGCNSDEIFSGDEIEESAAKEKPALADKRSSIEKIPESAKDKKSQSNHSISSGKLAKEKSGASRKSRPSITSSDTSVVSDQPEENSQPIKKKSILTDTVYNGRESIDPSDVDIFEASLVSPVNEANEEEEPTEKGQNSNGEKELSEETSKPKEPTTETKDKDSPKLNSKASENHSPLVKFRSIEKKSVGRTSGSKEVIEKDPVNAVRIGDITSDSDSTLELPFHPKTKLDKPETTHDRKPTEKSPPRDEKSKKKNAAEHSSKDETTEKSNETKNAKKSKIVVKNIARIEITNEERESDEDEIPTQVNVEHDESEKDSAGSINSLETVVEDDHENRIGNALKPASEVDNPERHAPSDEELHQHDDENVATSGLNSPNLNVSVKKSSNGGSSEKRNSDRGSRSKSPEINNTSRQSSRKSSLESLSTDDLETKSKKSSSQSISNLSRHSTSSDPSETDNLRMRDMLLMSSNSDESSPEDSSVVRNASTIDNVDKTVPTPPESDSNNRNSSAKDSSELENDNIIQGRTPRKLKRKKFRIGDNPLLKTDKKLNHRCHVRVERLGEAALERYSRALKKSRNYVDSKKFKRLVALDELDKKKRVINSSDSENDDQLLSKDSRIRKKGKKEHPETLMDHLQRVENGENTELSSGSEVEGTDKEKGSKRKSDNQSDDSLLAEADRMAKKRLLESSDSGEVEPSDCETQNKEDKTGDDKMDKITPNKAKKVVSNEKLDKPPEDEEKNGEKTDKGRWRKNKILTLRISDTDSDAEETKFESSQKKLSDEKKTAGSQSDTEEERTPKKKRIRRRVLHSDSDVEVSPLSDSESSDDSIKKKKKKGNDEDDGKKKNRKRNRKGDRSSDSSDSLDAKRPKNRRKRIKTADTDSDSDMENSQGTPGKSGRKNIRKVIRDKQVADDTKQAAKDEEERLQRIAERQKLYNEMYETRLAGEAKVEKLVLDFDEETKEPLVSVDEALVKRLKPHQAKGIKFIWDACFESLERTKSTKGSGCILAHCMGLGKTFQIVALSHTLLQHEETGIKTIMVVCPLSTVLNWVNEFKIWLDDLPDGDDIEIYELTRMKKNFERKYQLQRWQKTGGVMIIGYEMFRNLSNSGKKVRKNIQDVFLKSLVDPGPDLIVCDEGHLLKNEDTALSKAMRRVKTLRRIVLTGTPLQNNLIEYHCMVQFVKPNLLGTKKEFTNRFENPITNGQFDDSTEYDVRLMKKRAHVLHKMLEGSVQRLDYSVLTPFLPPKQEYVIFVKLTEIQIKMYRHYLDNYARRHRGVGGSLFADFQALQRIWTHPMVMRANAKKVELANEKKRLDATDSEGSLRDFIDDGSESATSDSSDVRSVSGSDDDGKKKPKRGTRANPVADEPLPSVVADKSEESHDDIEWWTQFVKEEDYEDMRISSKLLLLFSILKECHTVGDKVLVFSQSLYSLSLIEEFLRMIDDETQRGNQGPEHLDNHTGSWSLGLDYFRLDGQSSTDNRRRWCDIFNRPSNTRARLFLISTRAGGLGINLTAANRVIIFDASWNPSHDVQSIFRIYRFGQKKPCYVYRLLAAGTMEEKIYNRQVTKLSLSCRVVDEQQIERHYTNNALAELYKLEISDSENTLNLPKDRLLAEIFLKYKHCVENYHEHDSLLENQAGEELDEEERQQAWLEYEEEKKGKRVLPQTPFLNYQDEILLQQMNLINMQQQSAALSNPAMMLDYENIRKMMSKDYPGVSEAQQKAMATRTVYEMYNYVERQAMARQNPLAMLNMAGAAPIAFDNRMVTQVAPTTSHPSPEMIRMYQQSLPQQNNGQISYPTNNSILKDSMAKLRNIQMAQMAQLPQQSSISTTSIDDDIVEIPQSPEKNPPPPAPGGSRMNQEE